VLPERGECFIDGRHLSPRSASASSMACRSASVVMARTTKGGLVRGRRA
jgi:hypothetical protein